MKRFTDMDKEEKRDYYRMKTKEWRNKNPEKNKKLRKKYKKSEKGKIANRRYDNKPETLEKRREYFRKHPSKFKQTKEYIKNYMKGYMQDKDNHEKYLIRQKHNNLFRNLLIEKYGCCQECGSDKFLEIHHEEYNNSNSMEELNLLCRKCHRVLHRKK